MEINNKKMEIKINNKIKKILKYKQYKTLSPSFLLTIRSEGKLNLLRRDLDISEGAR